MGSAVHAPPRRRPTTHPLDLTVAPNGNIVVASEWPYGARDAMPSVREYEPASGRLVRVFAPDPSVGFARPRGLRFGPDGRLYCVGRDQVIAFDVSTGRYLEVVARLPRLNGQALVFLE
jgi:sugar lactone lactonase YvrE